MTSASAVTGIEVTRSMLNILRWLNIVSGRDQGVYRGGCRILRKGRTQILFSQIHSTMWRFSHIIFMLLSFPVFLLEFLVTTLSFLCC